MACQDQSQKPLLDNHRVGLSSETEHDSKKVMLHGERHDTITVKAVIAQTAGTEEVPETLQITRRQDTYHGPELELEADGAHWLLTAPGPDMQLLLWKGIETDGGYIEGWGKVAEIKASITGYEQYELCPCCNQPLRTLEHEREAATGTCNR